MEKLSTTRKDIKLMLMDVIFYWTRHMATERTVDIETETTIHGIDVMKVVSQRGHLGRRRRLKSSSQEEVKSRTEFEICFKLSGNVPVTTHIF